MHLTRRRAAPARDAGGFTLIELLVTLVVVSVGLMGLAKLQAAATAETQISRTRSIMTYQAESLAAAMRANRAYWGDATNPTPPTVTIAAGATNGNYTNTDTAAGPSAWKDCAAVPASACTPVQMTAFDLKAWIVPFATQFSLATAKIACGIASGPVTCDITLQWPERFVAINRSTAPVAGDTAPTGTLVIHVQP